MTPPKTPAAAFAGLIRGGNGTAVNRHSEDQGKPKVLKNKITAAGIVHDLSHAELHALAREVREWHKTGMTDSAHLSCLSSNLVSDAGLNEDGVTQVAEALVLQEVCDRWIAGNSH